MVQDWEEKTNISMSNTVTTTICESVMQMAIGKTKLLIKHTESLLSINRFKMNLNLGKTREKGIHFFIDGGKW